METPGLPVRYFAMDHSKLPTELSCSFVPSGDSPSALALVDHPDLSWMSHYVGRVLRAIFSRTTANALLCRGHMHVLSTEQTHALLAGSPGPFKSLLDIGAGDGSALEYIRRAGFETVHVTETNYAMTWRLWGKGHKVVSGREGKYDVVSCLNILDRCSHPYTLLRDLRRRLVPGTGRVLLAVVLPWCPFVEGPRGIQMRPAEYLTLPGSTCKDWKGPEHAVSTFVSSILTPLGYNVEAWTKVPYLCQGDRLKKYYTLDDYVFALSVSSACSPGD